MLFSCLFGLFVVAMIMLCQVAIDNFVSSKEGIDIFVVVHIIDNFVSKEIDIFVATHNCFGRR